MTTKIWKRTAVSALAAVMAVSMAPCRSEAKETSGEKTELTFWLTNEGENYEKVFDEFEKRAGEDMGIDIKVNWTTKHVEEMPLKLMNQEACDLTFDAYWVNLASNISNGLYADLSEYFDNDEYPGLKKAFTPEILETMVSDDGAIYAIPFLNSMRTCGASSIVKTGESSLAVSQSPAKKHSMRICRR